jgi:hypothetical protein
LGLFDRTERPVPLVSRPGGSSQNPYRFLLFISAFIPRYLFIAFRENPNNRPKILGEIDVPPVDIALSKSAYLVGCPPAISDTISMKL